MELKNFVSQTIQQIFEGVEQAQKLTEKRGIIAPSKIRQTEKEIPNHPAVIGFHHAAPIISVDFDISISTQDVTKEKAGAGIFIAAFGIGGQTGLETSSDQFNKIRFSIPVILPSTE